MHSLRQFLQQSLACLSVLSITSLATASWAQSDSVENAVKDAMKMDYRTEAEVARDADRQPVEALAFMGLRDDMKVIEFFPAGQAWYTKLLGPVLAEKGELYLIDSERTFERWGNLLDNPVFKNTHTIKTEASYNREERRYNLGELSIPVNDADIFLNIREYHNFNAADKARLNKAAFASLKSGGRYVIIDHTRRHMQPKDNANFRRADPVEVVFEVQAAGFVLDKVSTLFYQPSDDLTLEVGNEAVAGNTDRFFLVFKKP